MTRGTGSQMRPDLMAGILNMYAQFLPDALAAITFFRLCVPAMFSVH